MTDVGSSTLGTQTINPNMTAKGTQASNPSMATLGVQTNNPSMVDSHYQTSYEGQIFVPYYCFKCHKGFVSDWTLTRHRRDVHKENVLSASERKKLVNAKKSKSKKCIPPVLPSQAKSIPKSSPSPAPKPPPPAKKKRSLKLPPPPPKKVLKSLKRKGHELHEKEPEDLIKFKKQNISKSPPPRAKQTVGVKRKKNLCWKRF